MNLQEGFQNPVCFLFPKNTVLRSTLRKFLQAFICSEGINSFTEQVTVVCLPGSALAPEERAADKTPSLLVRVPTDERRHKPVIFKVNSCKAQVGGFPTPKTSIGATLSSQKVPEGATTGSS